MEIDSFLKSPIVIDNVNQSIKIGQWIYESRIQWIVKKTPDLPITVYFQ